MKNALFILSLMFISAHAFGSDFTPTEAEKAKMLEFGKSPKLGACMIVYKFDFFSEQLGFSIDGGKVSAEEKLNQFRLFINTGKLELKSPKITPAKYLPAHCKAIAQTVVEILAMNLNADIVQDKPAQDSQED